MGAVLSGRGMARRVLSILVLVAGAGTLLGVTGSIPRSAGAGPRVASATMHPTPPATLVPGQHAYSSTVRAGGRSVTIDYLLYVPASYRRQPARRWPLILFLHGRGERGSDLELLKAHPMPKILETKADFPAIVVSPQLALPSLWWTRMVEPLDALVQALAKEYPIDSGRLYLTGLSMGGFGTWEYGLRHPDRFAALVPIAGGWAGAAAVPRSICSLAKKPVWAFAGSADTTVYASESEVLVKALRRCGSKSVRFTLYRGADHAQSWLRAYASPALWRWLFAQRRAD